MTRDRKRGRPVDGAASTTFVKRAVVVVAVVTAGAGFAVQSGAFSSVVADRAAELDVVTDTNALIDVDTVTGVSVSGDGDSEPAECNFGTNDLVVTDRREEDVETGQDVVIPSGRGNTVDVDIETEGCLRVESGARLNGDVEAGGNVTVSNGGRLNGDVDAAGTVRVDSGGRSGGLTGDVEAGRDVIVGNGGAIGQRENTVDVEAGGTISVDSGGRIYGDVEAGGSVSVNPGGQITGDIEENADVGNGSDGPSEQLLLTVRNNLGADASVTVELEQPADGTLIVGAKSGSSVQFSVDASGDRDVSIEPASEGGEMIEVRITASAVGGDRTVTLFRTVPKTDG